MVAKLTLDNAVTLIRYCPDGNSLLSKAFDLSQRFEASRQKLRSMIPFPSRLMVYWDYLRYRKHLMERYKSKPPFDPKDLFK
jgi:hypothetical protein